MTKKSMVPGGDVQPPRAHEITIHTSHLFDPKQKKFHPNRSVTINPTTGLIISIYTRQFEPESINPPDIDLRGKTVLPGFVDAHTHIFLHSYTSTPSLNQERDESFIERILRATNHCRAALSAGYTTYRDLGTEGLGSADVSFRDAVNRGIIPGPRLFVATECIASSGGYAIRQENEMGGTRVPRLSDPADGAEGCRAAVRRRIGAGADVVKFYADYRKRALRFPTSAWAGAPDVQFPPGAGNAGNRGKNALELVNERNPNIPLFTQEEMNTMVHEAKISRSPIAAHAACPEAVIMAAKARVTTIEHSYEPSDEALKAMKDNNVIFVPTLSVIEDSLPRDGTFESVLAHTKKAFDLGIKIAAGGDTGAFAHGENAREMELLVEAGIPVIDVLRAATLHGWEACGGDLCGRKFGWWEEGVAADIVALDRDPVEDLKALRRVDFVMKDGKVYRRDGKQVNMN